MAPKKTPATKKKKAKKTASAQKKVGRKTAKTTSVATQKKSTNPKKKPASGGASSVLLEKPYPAPRFLVPDSNGKAITEKNLKGQWSVVYFYPKALTPGCTIQAGDFERARKKFAALGVQVFGVSKDSCARHQKFAEKVGFSFQMLSDEHTKMCESFDVWKEKSLYGRKFMGIERATFLVDPKGQIVAAWRQVKVGGHVDAVLAALETLIKR